LILYKIITGMAACLAALLAAPYAANADDPRPNLNWDTRSISGNDLASISDGAFGEQIDPHLGGISFSVVDVSIPGNFDLPVEIRRTRTQGRLFHPTETAAFGDWDLDSSRRRLS